MGAVKEWSLVICFAVLACALLETLLPEGNMQKMMHLIFGLFLICAIITPFFNLSNKFSITSKAASKCDDEIYKFTEKLSKQEKDIATLKVKDIAVEELNEIGVKAEKIAIFMDTTKKDSISIIKMRVHLNRQDKHKKEEVRQVLEKKLGLDIDVVI